VLLAILLHAATNMFVVSPTLTSSGDDLTLLLLAAAAKWLLVAVVIVVAGTSLVRSARPGPEVLPSEVLPKG
jgi:hypothetical protein